VRYEKDIGIEKDYMRAYAWLLLANDSVGTHIQDAISLVRSKLSEGQVSEAEVLASEFSQGYERKLRQPTT